MKTKAFALLLSLLALAAAAGLDAGTGDRAVLNRDFYSSVSSVPAILRDEFMDRKLNGIVTARGRVKSVEEMKRYKKRYRVALNDADSARTGMTIIYYLFMDNRDSIAMLEKGALVEFSGQLMACTPLNTRRDSYILDIVLEKGAIVIE
ncbi:MAG: hypothetical protein MUD12_00050 [Spirochaetes bacterium]|jgi:hypothetical protein|nr:hypothetical protein [Spirochaetota bacterium]